MSLSPAKRIFSPGSAFRHLGAVVSHAAQIPSTLSDPTIDAAFRERILLAVTSVNQCRYCAWVHTDLASSSGMSAEEIARLLSQETVAVPENELPAIQFALHYAETEGKPSESFIRELKGRYGEKTADSILNYIRMIYFANLSGNTFDAFMSRLKGHPHPEGKAWFEAAFAVFSAPVLLPIALMKTDLPALFKSA